MSGAGLSDSARLTGRLARLFLDPASGVAPDRCGVRPFTPEAIAAMAPAPRAALAAPLAAACGLGAVDLPPAHFDRMGGDANARRATLVATLPAEALVSLARALGTIVYTGLARRLVRKSERERFAAALGEGAAAIATRRGSFHGVLAALAPENASVADADRSDPAATPPASDADWQLPPTSAVISGEPAMVRHSLAIIAAWVCAVEPALGAVLQARFGAFGSAPELTEQQCDAVGGFIAQRLSS